MPPEGSASKLPSYNNDSPEIVTGIAAEFIHYLRFAGKATESDKKTMSLCKLFEKMAEPHLAKLRKAREEKRKAKQLKQQLREIGHL
jgi:hypothetical protein